MNDKIDFVITWVDNNDKKWQLEKEKYTSSSKGDSSSTRYRDWEILKYWFRSVEENASWVNKIYFVTYGHIPSWLNTNNPKLVIVKHSDFIPSSYLPTFNSCAIEVNFGNIIGLSEKFVYFNDDMFLNKRVKKSDFFKNNLPLDNPIFSPIFANGEMTSRITYNCMNIINKNFNYKDYLKNNKYKIFSLKNGKYLYKNITLFSYPENVGFRFHHLPTSFLKSTFKTVWDRENSYLKMVCNNKFRTDNDVSQWLFQFWQLASGNFEVRNVNIGKYYELSNDFTKIINDIINKKHKMICLNDTVSVEDFSKKKDELIMVFNKRYPNKSSYEK